MFPRGGRERRLFPTRGKPMVGSEQLSRALASRGSRSVAATTPIYGASSSSNGTTAVVVVAA